MFLFYDNNVNQLPYLTRDHKWFYRSALLRLILMQKEGEIKKQNAFPLPNSPCLLKILD